MPRKSARSGKSAKSKQSATWMRAFLQMNTPHARALGLAVMFVMIATFVVMAGREPSLPDETTFDEQLPASDVVEYTTRSQATTRTASSALKPTVVATGSETVRLAEPEVIAITGCLERDGDGFRLTDTEGEDAPQSRSWTTGFVTRRNRSVDVSDPRNRFKLANHVDERVRVTGTLVDGDMELRSMRRVAMTCEQEG